MVIVIGVEEVLEGDEVGFGVPNESEVDVLFLDDGAEELLHLASEVPEHGFLLVLDQVGQLGLERLGLLVVVSVLVVGVLDLLEVGVGGVDETLDSDNVLDVVGVVVQETVSAGTLAGGVGMALAEVHQGQGVFLAQWELADLVYLFYFHLIFIYTLPSYQIH